MKKIPFYLSILSVFTLLFFQSCTQDLCDRSSTFIRYDPIYLQVDEIRKDIQIQDAKPLTYY